ncbi:aldo/keto reductase [Klebsiella pneumoniae]|uniref:aldo/keto reductase n=1 Tax=Klebsiella pneumoniae TaxID=573 RepID=UPI00188C4442|nr:aldo/keto reductase [Klebsiella pneumoniae]
MTTSRVLDLNDGNHIPQLGLGVWQANPEQTVSAVREALLTGYRHIDTAAIYENEEGVGAGIRQSGVARNEIFVTTKVWNSDQGEKPTRLALQRSLGRLGLDYVDLLLIHWPAPLHDRYVETWRTMIELRKEGLVRSIGVSNFTTSNLERIIAETNVTPAINQIELHPYMQQVALRGTHEKLGVLTECWSPLAQNRALSNPVITRIAEKHSKTPAQIVIRWHLDNGFVVIPKSVTAARIRDNHNVFNFTLDTDDMSSISQLERGERIGPDPQTFA